jgi:hypothetical protein
MKYIFYSCLILLLFGCGEEVVSSTEKPLATVFEKSLYPSDIEGLVGKNVSVKDSALLVNSYIENWAREQLITAIAEQNIPADLDVDQLVDDYRKSLIRHTYERKLVEQRLDSAITETEIEAYYEGAKDQYQLEETVVRGYFIKLLEEAPQQDSLAVWWKMKSDYDKEKLVEYCRSYADKFLIQDSTWVSADYLAAEFPVASLSEGNLVNGYQVNTKNDGYLYFVKLNKVVKKGKTAPLSYVREKIVRIILRKRKFELLENMTEVFYKRELQKKNVMIFDN